MCEKRKKRGEGNLKRKKNGSQKVVNSTCVGSSEAKGSYFFRCGLTDGAFYVLSTHRGLCAQPSGFKGQYVIQIFMKIP